MKLKKPIAQLRRKEINVGLSAKKGKFLEKQQSPEKNTKLNSGKKNV